MGGVGQIRRGRRRRGITGYIGRQQRKPPPTDIHPPPIRTVRPNPKPKRTASPFSLNWTNHSFHPLRPYPCLPPMPLFDAAAASTEVLLLYPLPMDFITANIASAGRPNSLDMVCTSLDVPPTFSTTAAAVASAYDEFNDYDTPRRAGRSQEGGGELGAIHSYMGEVGGYKNKKT